MGADALQMLLERINLDELSYSLRDSLPHETSQQRKAEALEASARSGSFPRRRYRAWKTSPSGW